MSSNIMKVVEMEINEQLVEYLVNYIKYNYNNAPDDGIDAPSDNLIREHIHKYISQVPFEFKETEVEETKKELEVEETKKELEIVVKKIKKIKNKKNN